MAQIVSYNELYKKANKKIALINGITGQDGSYLAEFLLEKGYEVHGVISRSSSFNRGRVHNLYKDQSSCIVKLIHDIRPNEIYNLAQSHLKASFDLSEYAANVDAMETLRILDAIRTANLGKDVKLYQYSSSELYGKVHEVPQRETTPFYPRTPYGVSKLYDYWIVINYREVYNIFAVNGILFNHESPRRAETFVTRKITRSVAKILFNELEYFELGNLDAKRDWGHARDYIEATWLMLQEDIPRDYVIATGESHSVREFVELAFEYIGRNIIWEGKGVNEVGKERETGIIRVRVNPMYFRPSEVDFLLGDSTKARINLKWTPKTTFMQLVHEMVDSDIKLMRKNPAV